VDVPATLYAWNGDVGLAYQVVGDGAIALLYLQGWASHVELDWESPHLAAFLRGLAAIGRLITTDRRGWGCSDRFSPFEVPPMETLVEDVSVVMDAVESDRCVVAASWECAAISVLFAAAHPERVQGLILIDPWVTYVATDETPWLWSPEDVEEDAARIRTEYPLRRWFEGVGEREGEWLARLVKFSVGPGALIAEFRRFQATDVRALLPLIQVPTLVLGNSESKDERGSPNASFVADRIPASKLALLPAGTHPQSGWQHWYDRREGILQHISRFVRDLKDEQAAFDRVLATVMFTDIVGSTKTAARLGDAAWGSLLQRHDATVRALLGRYVGREIDTAGDGFFATFDGPARAVQCARAAIEAVRPLGLEIRAGVHTGEVELAGDAVRGIAVHIGARVGALAGPSQVLVSQTVKDLTAGSGLVFEDAGEHELTGVPDRWRLYRVVG